MTRAFGIDVSHHRPIRDYDALYGSGCSFVGMKATEGNSVTDPTLRTHREEFRRRPFVLGIYYHFARSGSPEKQAERFQDVVGVLRDNERLALDLEVSPVTDPKQGLEWVERFFDVLVGGMCSDRKPIIYTSNRKWIEVLGDPDWALASEVDLWCPRYSGSPTVEPVLPKPWKARGWTFWQFADDFDAAGVGPCDGNYFKGDVDELRRYATLDPPVPEPWPFAP